MQHSDARLSRRHVHALRVEPHHRAGLTAQGEQRAAAWVARDHVDDAVLANRRAPARTEAGGAAAVL